MDPNKGSYAVGMELSIERVSASHGADRKSTRLNSSHLVISYAVFCLKKKKETAYRPHVIRRAGSPRSVGHSHVPGCRRSQLGERCLRRWRRISPHLAGETRYPRAHRV